MLGYPLLGDDVHTYLHLSVFEHLKQSCYWVLWDARPFRNFIQFFHVSLCIAIPLAKMPYQVLKNTYCGGIVLHCYCHKKCAMQFPTAFTDTEQDFQRFCWNRHCYRQLHMHTGMIFINCEVSSAGNGFKSLPVKGKFSFLTEIMFSLHKKSL